MICRFKKYTVFATKRPLRNIDTALQKLFPGLREPPGILGRYQIGDGLSNDLLARVPEHAAPCGVDIGVATVEVRDEDSVGSLLDELTGPRETELEHVVRAVERGGGDSEQE